MIDLIPPEFVPAVFFLLKEARFVHVFGRPALTFILLSGSIKQNRQFVFLRKLSLISQGNL